MATFGDVFGLAFGLEGFSFFLEAIFITIYVYGWDRLPRKVHFMTGIPIVITGITGSMMVIAVNGWMNNPVGFDIVNGSRDQHRPVARRCSTTYFWHELVHMYLAGLHRRRIRRGFDLRSRDDARRPRPLRARRR